MLVAEAALDYLIKHPAYIEVCFAQGSLAGWNYLSCFAQIILLGVNEYISKVWIVSCLEQALSADVLPDGTEFILADLPVATSGSSVTLHG